MTEDGRNFGIVPTLEPISYQAVHSIPDAVALARTAGCSIVVDALHFNRFGAVPGPTSGGTSRRTWTWCRCCSCATVPCRASGRP